MKAAGGRRLVTGTVLGVLLLVVSLPASRSDGPALAAVLVAAAALAGAGAARPRPPTLRAVGIAVVFLGGGILVRLLTGSTDLATAWFLACLGGVGIGASLSRHAA